MSSSAPSCVPPCVVCFLQKRKKVKLEGEVDRRESIQVMGHIAPRGRKSHNNVSERLRKHRRAMHGKILQDIAVKLNDQMGCSPLPTMKSKTVSRVDTSAGLALSRGVTQNSFQSFRRLAPETIPTLKDIKAEAQSVPESMFEIVCLDGERLIKYNMEQTKSLDFILIQGHYAVVYPDPVDYIMRHLEYALRKSTTDDQKYLARKIIVGADEGQSMFSFGFFIAVNGQSRNHFQPLFYYYPMKTAEKAAIDKGNAAKRIDAKRMAKINANIERARVGADASIRHDGSFAPPPSPSPSPTPSCDFSPNDDDDDEEGFSFNVYETLKSFGSEMLQKLDDWIASVNRHNSTLAEDDIHRIDIFLSGDWKFLNEFLGLKGPTSTYGCCICTREAKVSHGVEAFPPSTIGRLRDINFHKGQCGMIPNAFAVHRRTGKPPHTLDDFAAKAHVNFKGVLRMPLLPSIYQKDHIVPLPLHVFLGLGNAIFQELVVELKKINDFAYQAYLKDVYDKNYKQRPSDILGAQKLSSAMGFNGEELRTIFNDNTEQFNPVTERNEKHWPMMDWILSIPNIPRRKQIWEMFTACNELSWFLSVRRRFTEEDLQNFKALTEKYAPIWRNAKNKTRPKAHMLFHCLAFAQKWKFLTPFGENPIESHHHHVKTTFQKFFMVGVKKIALKQLRLAQSIAVDRSLSVREGQAKLSTRRCRKCKKKRTTDYLDDPCECNVGNKTPRG